MVSTRGVRYKFTEGERVLCYEPDPTKAKVLYDSKVLEVIESKDKRGRRTVEYLIHFQGWNSSWDRCVSEDFVLKDTEENRQLQRDLAEKSQLQLGAYLYRRERKKTSSATTAGPAAKRSRQGFSDDGSSSSTQPEGGILSNECTEPETGDTDSSGSVTSTATAPPLSHPGRAHVNLPAALRDWLTFDYHVVVKRNHLARTPAQPSAADVLESFVKWFARSGAWRQHKNARPDLLDVICRLNLVREVADGLRVFFDFVLRDHLLYRQEHQQYYDMCGQFDIPDDDDSDVEEDEDDDSSSPKEEDDRPELEEATMTMMDGSQNSPNSSDYTQVPSDAPDEDRSEDTQEDESNSTEKTEVESVKSPPEKPVAAEKPVEQRSTRSTSLPRRLRSHKSPVSQEGEEAAPSPSTSTAGASPSPAAATSTATAAATATVAVDPPAVAAVVAAAIDTRSSSVGSSASSVSGCRSRRPAAAAAPPLQCRTPLSLLLEKVAKWQIVPREGTAHLPCRVYGATHLARLFVRLPDFLNATHMPDMKLKLILKHIDMFIQYLEEHAEWFGESFYIENPVRAR